MRLKHPITILLILCSLLSKAQLYDAQWAIGYDESAVDFRIADTVKIDTLPTLQYFFLTNASICDEAGKLLYYTNGVGICGINDTLLNGNNLSRGIYSSNDSLDGLPIAQGAIFIPKPGSTRYYYLFHSANDTLQYTRPGHIYYSLIDKEANNGLGAVIEKDVPIISRHILREGGITACKHANGRDYWLVFGASGTNKFYKFLITPDSIIGPFTQDIGPNYPLPADNAYSKFSQDGSKYATGAISGLVLVMDFDRCNGEFTNPVTIFNNSSTNPDTSISCSVSVEFSPNNRFIYVSDNRYMTQYDLLSTNIQDSLKLFLEDSATWYGIRFLQIAPNGKIYGSTWNGGLYALHVINSPDLKGDSADFVYGGQPTLTVASYNLPNLINYKLGALFGNGCDTITTGLTAQTANDPLRIQPNPANKYAYVEMGMQGNYIFQLLDATGKLLSQKQTPQIDIFDTEQLPNGIYFISVKDRSSNAEIANRRVVVAH